MRKIFLNLNNLYRCFNFKFKIKPDLTICMLHQGVGFSTMDDFSSYLSFLVNSIVHLSEIQFFNPHSLSSQVTSIGSSSQPIMSTFLLKSPMFIFPVNIFCSVFNGPPDAHGHLPILKQIVKNIHLQHKPRFRFCCIVVSHHQNLLNS